jgi:hypothetical protein
LKNINTASYCCNLPGLVIWVAVLARILFKARQLRVLIMISVLMVVYQISDLIAW